MKRFLATLAAAGLLVGLVAGPVAAAGVQRNQNTTVTYTVAVLNTWIHNYTVTVNGCDGTIAITGSTPLASGYYTTETVTGTLTNGVITYTSTYNGPYNPGYSYSGSFSVLGGALGGDYTGTVTAGPNTAPVYATHGAYVSAMGGGADAAHSCIGMPIVAQQ